MSLSNASRTLWSKYNQFHSLKTEDVPVPRHMACSKRGTTENVCHWSYRPWRLPSMYSSRSCFLPPAKPAAFRIYSLHRLASRHSLRSWCPLKWFIALVYQGWLITALGCTRKPDMTETRYTSTLSSKHGLPTPPCSYDVSSERSTLFIASHSSHVMQQYVLYLETSFRSTCFLFASFIIIIVSRHLFIFKHLGQPMIHCWNCRVEQKMGLWATRFITYSIILTNFKSSVSRKWRGTFGSFQACWTFHYPSTRSSSTYLPIALHAIMFASQRSCRGLCHVQHKLDTPFLKFSSSLLTFAEKMWWLGMLLKVHDIFFRFCIGLHKIQRRPASHLKQRFTPLWLCNPHSGKRKRWPLRHCAFSKVSWIELLKKCLCSLGKLQQAVVELAVFGLGTWRPSQSSLHVLGAKDSVGKTPQLKNLRGFEKPAKACPPII